MRVASSCYTLLLVVVLLGFGFGLSKLFVLRFEAGDFYPPYSSLRSDPLGSKAFYRSLEAIPGIRVARGFSALSKQTELQGTTVLVLGETEDFFTRTGGKDLAGLQRLVGAGNRLVIGLLPRTGMKADADKKGRGAKVNGAPGKSQDGKSQDAKGQDAKGQDAKGQDAKGRDVKGQDVKGQDAKGQESGSDAEPIKSLAKQWGVTPENFADSGKGESLRVAPAGGGPDLPEKLPRHSRLFFQLTGSDWQTIYRSADQPVIVERRMGKGSIVLLADCYPLSNQALRGGAEAALLTWIIGDNRRALFDEFHLGVGDPPGMGTLLRRYHLETFFIGLFLLALLYVWKSFVPFLKVPPLRDTGRATSGKDNFTGLVNLLRRTIPREKLLASCFSEWRRSFAREYREHPEKLVQVEALLEEEALLPARRRDVPAAYRRISELLALKRTGQKPTEDYNKRTLQ
jgi:hypothetical protein